MELLSCKYNFLKRPFILKYQVYPPKQSKSYVQTGTRLVSGTISSGTNRTENKITIVAEMDPELEL